MIASLASRHDEPANPCPAADTYFVRPGRAAHPAARRSSSSGATRPTNPGYRTAAP